MGIKFTIATTDYETEEVVLPSKFEVCPRCEGRGVHDHPAFSNGITASEWNGPDWDDDSREAYVRGDYDVQCEQCKGLRVVEVVDVEHLDAEQQEQYRQYREHQEQVARWDAEDRAIRRMESGGY